MKILGAKITLRPAGLFDRKKVYLWLAKSDLTASMLGAPNYPDGPVPTWKEFRQDYGLSFFNFTGNKKGRNYLILANGEEVGTVGYDLFDATKSHVVLDIWLRAEKYSGHGYGSDALRTLCDFLQRKYGIQHFYISPSARNQRAVAAYQKAGFVLSDLNRESANTLFGIDVFDYDDNVLLVKHFLPD